MTGQKVIEGAREALAWTKATNRGRHLATKGDKPPAAGRYADSMGRQFDAIPRYSAEYVVMNFDDGCFTCMDYRTFAQWEYKLVEDWGWKPDAGRVVLDTHVHERPQPVEPALPHEPGVTP